MHLSLICVGHAQPSWVIDGSQTYAQRFNRRWPFSLNELRPEKRSDGKPSGPLLEAEAVRIRAALPKSAALVALDERGECVSSRQLSEKLSSIALENSACCFVIGSADGLDARLKASAHWLWSLSPLTLPHGLARVVAIEQLYRAISLLDGHPYHRD